jgi:hypothetical protein
LPFTTEEARQLLTCGTADCRAGAHHHGLQHCLKMKLSKLLRAAIFILLTGVRKKLYFSIRQEESAFD